MEHQSRLLSLEQEMRENPSEDRCHKLLYGAFSFLHVISLLHVLSRTKRDVGGNVNRGSPFFSKHKRIVAEV